MNQLIRVKIDDLDGPALNWAAAKVEHPDGVCFCKMGIVALAGTPIDLRHSSDWRQGGPLLAKYFGEIVNLHPSPETWPSGDDLLPWAMRAIVKIANQFADEVDVPALLWRKTA